MAAAAVAASKSSAQRIWRSVNLSARELRCDVTLTNGQTFNWRPHASAPDEWIGVFTQRVVILKQTPSATLFRLPQIVPITDERVTEHTAGAAASASPSPKRKRSAATAAAAAPAASDVSAAAAGGGAADAKSSPPPAASSSSSTATAAAAAAADSDQQLIADSPLSDDETEVLTALRTYFQSQFSLAELTATWSAADPHMALIAPCFEGMRLLQIDPTECLFSFICSSNNNIARIHKMLDALRKEYGTRIGLYYPPPAPPLATPASSATAAATSAAAAGTNSPARKSSTASAPAAASDGGLMFYSFPSVESLAARATDERLRALGFGYRAKFVVKTAELVQSNGGESWLMRLRDEKDPAAVKEKLMTLHGVGPKVADCIALFSLNQYASIPLDTHVFQIAARDYAHHFPLASTRAALAAQKMSQPLYRQVSTVFQTLFGTHAGWAHSILFTADLPAYRHRLPDSIKKKWRVSDAAAGAGAGSPKKKKAAKGKTKEKAKSGAAAAAAASATSADPDATESDTESDAESEAAAPPPLKKKRSSKAGK